MHASHMHASHISCESHIMRVTYHTSPLKGPLRCCVDAAQGTRDARVAHTATLKCSDALPQAAASRRGTGANRDTHTRLPLMLAPEQKIAEHSKNTTVCHACVCVCVFCFILLQLRSAGQRVHALLPGSPLPRGRRYCNPPGKLSSLPNYKVPARTETHKLAGSFAPTWWPFSTHVNFRQEGRRKLR